MGSKPKYGVPMNTIIRLRKPEDIPKFQCRLCGKEHQNENYGFCSKFCRKEHPSFLVSYEFTGLQLAREFVQKRRKNGVERLQNLKAAAYKENNDSNDPLFIRSASNPKKRKVAVNVYLYRSR